MVTCSRPLVLIISAPEERSGRIQLAQPIDDARRTAIGALHQFLNLLAGTRRVKCKSKLFALAEELRFAQQRVESAAQCFNALARDSRRNEERPPQRKWRKRRPHQEPVVLASDEIGREWHVRERGDR